MASGGKGGKKGSGSAAVMKPENSEKIASGAGEKIFFRTPVDMKINQTGREETAGGVNFLHPPRPGRGRTDKDRFDLSPANHHPAGKRGSPWADDTGVEYY